MKCVKKANKLCKKDPDFYEAVKNNFLFSDHKDSNDYIKLFKSIRDKNPILWNDIKDKIGSKMRKSMEYHEIERLFNDFKKFYEKNPEIVKNQNYKKNLGTLINVFYNNRIYLGYIEEIYNHTDLWTNDKYVNTFKVLIILSQTLYPEDYNKLLSSPELLDKLSGIIEENDNISYKKLSKNYSAFNLNRKKRPLKIQKSLFIVFI